MRLLSNRPEPNGTGNLLAKEFGDDEGVSFAGRLLYELPVLIGFSNIPQRHGAGLDKGIQLRPARPRKTYDVLMSSMDSKRYKMSALGCDISILYSSTQPSTIRLTAR